MKYDKVIVGDRLKSIREELKYSRESFAEKLDISVSFLSKVERGNKEFSTRTLVKFSELTKSSTDYILFGATDSYSSGIIDSIVNELSTFSNSDLNQIYQMILLIKKLDPYKC